MPENAFLMIHDPAGLVMGTAEDMRAMAEALDKVKGSPRLRLRREIRPDTGGGLRADGRRDLVRRGRRGGAGLRRPADPSLSGSPHASTSGASATRRQTWLKLSKPSRSPATRATAVRSKRTRIPMTPPKATRSRTPRTSGPPSLDTALPPSETPPASAAPPDPSAIRADAIGHARAVIDLCRLAGQPQMAGRFLEQDASLEEVRAALLAAKAEAEPEIAPPSPAARPFLGRAPLGRDRRPHLQPERMSS